MESPCVITTPACEGESETVIVEGETFSVKAADLVSTGVLESETLNVRDVALAVAVGVPVIVPALWLNERPAGSVPAVNDHLYGAVPPVAASVAV